MQRKFYLLGMLFLLCATAMTAQTSLSANANTSLTLTADENTFFEDAANQVLYIDFENVKVNLSDLKVKDAKGEIVMKDELWSLPVNTIYELDYSTFKPGEYEIEVRSYTGVLKRKVSVK